MKSGFGRFLDPEWEDQYLAARQKSAETGKTQSIELPLKTENGSPLWVRAEIEARKNEADETIQWRMVLVDITEQKMAYAALRESEARFSSMFEYNTSGVAVYEPVDNGSDFQFIAFNPAAEQITRITKDEALGNRLLDLFPNMDKTGLLDALRRVWRTGRSEQLPPFYYKDKNREGWRENRIYKLPSDEVVALFDDITARKEAEEALRKSENKLKTLIEALPDMVWEFDENEVFTFCSPSYKENLGYEPSDLIGKSVYTLMPPDEAHKVKKAFETIKREKKTPHRFFKHQPHQEWRNQMAPFQCGPYHRRCWNLQGIQRDRPGHNGYQKCASGKRGTGRSTATGPKDGGHRHTGRGHCP